MQKKLSRKDVIKALNIMFASPLRLINFNEWRKQVEKAIEEMKKE